MSSANCNCDGGSPPGGSQDSGTTTNRDATRDATVDGALRDFGPVEDDTGVDTGIEDIGERMDGTMPTDGPIMDAGADAATDGPRPDARADAGDARTDAMPDAASDAMPRDTGDGGPPCINDTPCDRGLVHGLCTNGSCVPCMDPQDDARCSTAYGMAPGTYVCHSGSCVSGNCRSNMQCPMGQICGLSTAFTCAPCVNDSQCAADPGYPNTICEVASGRCVSNACTPPPHRCSANPSDFCCPAPAGGGGTCRHGNCCTDAECAGGIHCIGGVCTQCTAATGGMYYVSSNPAIGNDSATTGSMNCPFRTISHAFAFLGTPASDVTIVVSGGPNFPIHTGEDFPLIVPRNVHLVGDTANIPVIRLNMLESGFTLSSPNSSISHFDIDCQRMGDTAIDVVTGSALSTSIDHVHVQRCVLDGITVHDSAGSNIGGVLSIGAGTSSMLNGTNPLENTSGMWVTDDGAAIITGATTGLPEDQISFSNNSYYGIWVRGRGFITLTATPAMGGAGNVIANSNFYGGIGIEQNAGPNLPLNQITGLSAWDNGPPGNQGDGIVVAAPSHARVRGCILLNNHGSGINVTKDTNDTDHNTDITGVDLGRNPTSDPGRNIVQVAIGGSNINAGICLYVDDPNANLQAQGNIFSGPNDCSRPSPPRISTNDMCMGRTDIALESTTRGHISTNNCPQ